MAIKDFIKIKTESVVRKGKNEEQNEINKDQQSEQNKNKPTHLT